MHAASIFLYSITLTTYNLGQYCCSSSTKELRGWFNCFFSRGHIHNKKWIRTQVLCCSSFYSKCDAFYSSLESSWGTFVEKFVVKKFLKSSDLVTLVPSDVVANTAQASLIFQLQSNWLAKPWLEIKIDINWLLCALKCVFNISYLWKASVFCLRKLFLTSKNFWVTLLSSPPLWNYFEKFKVF